jgi:hypothetical protein
VKGLSDNERRMLRLAMTSFEDDGIELTDEDARTCDQLVDRGLGRPRWCEDCQSNHLVVTTLGLEAMALDEIASGHA